MRTICCLGIVMVVATMVGCGGVHGTPPDGTSAASEAYAEQLKRNEENFHRVDAQYKRLDQILDKQKEHSDRLDKILDKWEEQARRYDAILDKLEEQSSRAKRD